MLRKVIVSAAVGVALFSATVRLPAVPCIVTNTPSEKACQSGCCPNKTCCATSHKRTGPPVQPFAKPGSDQGNIAILPSPVAVAVLNYAPIKSFVFLSADCMAHSPPPLALTCIRLI